MSKSRTLRAALPMAMLAAVVVVVVGATASADSPAKRDAATITMNFNHAQERFFFDGPKTVEAGDKLKIRNDSNPRVVGPHTFSLVRKGDLPKGRSQIKACGKKLKGICGAVVKWHEVDLETGQVGKEVVDVGKNGWDTEGSLKRKGDSWVSERKGEQFSQKVKARAGKTLHFICAVHPDMQGKIDVTGS